MDIAIKFVLMIFHTQVYGQLSKVGKADIDNSILVANESSEVYLSIDPNTLKVYVINYFSNIYQLAQVC